MRCWKFCEEVETRHGALCEEFCEGAEDSQKGLGLYEGSGSSVRGM